MSENTDLYGFISTGDKVALYTLRIMSRVRMTIFGRSQFVLRDYYVKNLSNDKAKAENAAKTICDQLNIPFKGDASFELNEIKRQRDGEAAEKKAEYDRQQREYQEAQTERFQRQLAESVMLTGKYLGKSPAELVDLDLGYLFWIASEFNDDYLTPNNLFQISASIAKKYVDENNIKPKGYVGEIDESIELTLTLKNVIRTNGQYPSYCFKCNTPDGYSIVFFSTAKAFLALQPGETFKVTAIVRNHSEYNRVCSTVLTKQKIVK